MANPEKKKGPIPIQELSRKTGCDQGADRGEKTGENPKIEGWVKVEYFVHPKRG